MKVPMYMSFDEQRVKLNLYIYGNGFSKSLVKQGQTEMSAWGMELIICKGVLMSLSHTLNSIKIRELNLWIDHSCLAGFPGSCHSVIWKLFGELLFCAIPQALGRWGAGDSGVIQSPSLRACIWKGGKSLNSRREDWGRRLGSDYS